MTILLTSFDAFGEAASNASQELLLSLPEQLGTIRLVKHVRPTVFGRAADEAAALIDALQPDAVVCLGQAEGRDAITPERVAINVMDARMPDNDGFQPRDLPITPEGPDAYFSTLPIRRMVEAIEAASVPARISNTAGTFVCNSLMYALLQHIGGLETPIPCGFIHVPPLDTQPRPAGTPALPLGDLRRGLIAALQSLASSENA